MTDAGYVQVQDSPSLSSPKGSHLHSANNAALRPAAVRREERWCCFVIVIFIMRRAGDRVLLGWLGRAGAGDSFYYSSSPPPAPALLLSTPCTPTVTWSPVTWSLITLDTVTPDANISLCPSFHIQSGLGRQCRCIEMLNVNVHLKALIERMERQLFR